MKRNVFGGVLYEGKEALEDSKHKRMSIGMRMIGCALGENGRHCATVGFSC